MGAFVRGTFDPPVPRPMCRKMDREWRVRCHNETGRLITSRLMRELMKTSAGTDGMPSKDLGC